MPTRRCEKLIEVRTGRLLLYGLRGPKPCSTRLRSGKRLLLRRIPTTPMPHSPHPRPAHPRSPNPSVPESPALRSKRRSPNREEPKQQQLKRAFRSVQCQRPQPTRQRSRNQQSLLGQQQGLPQTHPQHLLDLRDHPRQCLENRRNLL